jgi:hypothetical protein
MNRHSLEQIRKDLELEMLKGWGDRYAWALHTEPVKRVLDTATKHIFTLWECLTTSLVNTKDHTQCQIDDAVRKQTEALRRDLAAAELELEICRRHRKSESDSPLVTPDTDKVRSNDAPH